MAGGAARLYEPVLGRLLEGTRRAVLALAPPRPGMVVVDVGCGSGALLARYAAGGCRVAGLDPSPAMLREARRRLGPSALLAVGGGAALPFPSGRIDLVTATMLLHVLPAGERVATLAEMARVTAGRGWAVVADYGTGRGTGPAARTGHWLAGAIEGLAGHVGGVRSLRAAGGAAALAGRAGLAVERQVAAAGGTIAVVLLRPSAPASR